VHQQLWGYKVEDKLYLGVREQKRLNTTVLEDVDHQQRCCEDLKYHIQEDVIEICSDDVSSIELAQNHVKWMVYLCIPLPESVTI
jgi:hypothetical protein